jgi:hypothetical protein
MSASIGGEPGPKFTTGELGHTGAALQEGRNSSPEHCATTGKGGGSGAEESCARESGARGSSPRLACATNTTEGGAPGVEFTPRELNHTGAALLARGLEAKWLQRNKPPPAPIPETRS